MVLERADAFREWEGNNVPGQREHEVDGAPDPPSVRHRPGEPSYACFLGLDMQLLHRVRWLVRHHHDETGSCFL